MLDESNRSSKVMSIPLARPRAITTISILMFAVTIGGIVLTVIFGLFLEIDAPRYLIGFVGLGYSASALASAVGLWRLAPWSVGALAVWGVLAALLTLLMTATAGATLVRVLVVTAAAALSIAGLAIYVSRQLRRAEPKAN